MREEAGTKETRDSSRPLLFVGEAQGEKQEPTARSHPGALLGKCDLGDPSEGVHEASELQKSYTL